MVLGSLIGECRYTKTPIFLPLIEMDLPSLQLIGSVPTGVVVQCPAYFLSGLRNFVSHCEVDGGIIALLCWSSSSRLALIQQNH